ncbi:hypothetical protein RGQ13_01625 [Thalassotalea psychrophila]|uniref:Uncharacterized protein n=1 Tax=Thalassotalea psychrophila TaxID=3065647 RepID=A0ABY9TV36_9GAMM|nr:hypothetical protein RGQ13_01625 [Colwelliaceae bacterium SQ149]
MISLQRIALFLFTSFLLTGCPSDSSDPENLPPEIQLLTEKLEYQEGEIISLAAVVSDEDGDELQILWEVIDAPFQITLEKISDQEVQLIVAKPLEQSVVVTVQVTVSDGNIDIVREAQVTITPNLEPTITYDSDTYTFQLGEALSFPVTIIDSDSENLDISWSIIGSPKGYGISSSSSLVQLTAPDVIEDPVNLTAQVQVSDGYNSLTKEFAISILPKDIIQVSLVYPPAKALTDARSTVIRGVSSSELSSLTVNGQSVTSSDNFLSWTVSLAIEEFDTLVITPDSTIQATQVVEYNNFSRTIKHTKPFILENESLTVSGDMVYLVNDSSKQIVKQNLLTDERTIIFQATADFDFEPEQAIVDEANNRLVIAGSLDADGQSYGLTIVALDLSSLTTTVLFQDLVYEAYESIAFNGDNNKLLIPDWHSDGSIFEIDLTTGVKSMLYNAKADFGIVVDRGYKLKYHNGDLLWGDVDTPTLYKINQTTDQMSVLWQETDYQAEIDDLDLSLRFFEEFIYDEGLNKLTLILDEGVITFNLTQLTIESFVDFNSVISPFQEVEAAYVSGRNVHIWDDDGKMLITYNLDSGEYVSTGNENINIGLPSRPRSIGLSNDEKSLYYTSDDTSVMYRFPIDAADNSQLESPFDLSINNATDGQPYFQLEAYAPINPTESGFYMNKMYSDAGVYFFEFDTLAITNIALFEDIESQLAIDFDSNLAYTLTKNSNYNGSEWITEIIWKRVNLDSGEVTDFSTNLDHNDTEFEYDSIDSLTLTPDGTTIIAEVDDNLLKIATSDGAVSWLSKDKVMPNLLSNNIQNYIWANDELIAINSNSNSGIYKLDQLTGEFTELSGKYEGSGATPFDFENGVYLSDLQQFFIVDNDLDAIYAIDEVTGERLIIHK